ncbi:mycothiol maleylpyruvate isomerase [Streptacidiphilus monticola]
MDDLRSACGRFVESVSLVPESGWDFLVPHRTGPDFAVRTVPHKRIKEVEYHHVDLGLGYRPKDWPADFVAEELAELLARYEKDDRFPAMLLTDAASGAEHRIGGEGGAPERIAGAPADLLAWLSGRSSGEGLSVPPAALPPVPPML